VGLRERASQGMGCNGHDTARGGWRRSCGPVMGGGVDVESRHGVRTTGGRKGLRPVTRACSASGWVLKGNARSVGTTAGVGVCRRRNGPVDVIQPTVALWSRLRLASRQNGVRAGRSRSRLSIHSSVSPVVASDGVGRGCRLRGVPHAGRGGGIAASAGLVIGSYLLAEGQ
jgi:hypothetical protein